MARQRIHRARSKTAAEAAREAKIRERFGREKPTLAELEASGEYEPAIRQGEYFDLMRALVELRRRREKEGLSLAEVAKRSGIDRAAISRLENGLTGNPTFQTLERYARALGATVRLSILDDPHPATSVPSP